MKNKPAALVPFFILGCFFVHYSLDYFYFLDLSSVLFACLKYFAITGLLYFTGQKIFKNKEKFTLVFSTMLFIFLFFGSFIDTAEKYRIININVVGIDLKLITAFALLCIIIILLTVWFGRNTVKRLITFWIIYCIVFMLYDGSRFFLSHHKEKEYLSGRKELVISPTSTKPSLFYFVFDMYPSDTVFRRYFNYDNSELATFLRQKDFFVTGNARSLYDETYYSLSSTLNLEPLNFYTDRSLSSYKKILIALERTGQTPLLSAFENLGYTFYNSSVFDLQHQPSPLLFNLNYYIKNILTATTFFNRIYNEAEPDFLLAGRNIDLRFLKRSWSEVVQKDITTLDANFNNLLDTIPVNAKPCFSYFHYMIPHPPLLYDSSGHQNPIRDMYYFNGYENEIQHYISYTKYGNKKIEAMVKRIFQKLGTNVVIIIQGDHGFREYPGRLPEAARYGILNAVYLPGKNYANFNDTLTPIETFKQILNNQFHTVVN